MEFSDYTRKLEELDHLLQDPDAPVEPDRVWMLLADITRHDLERPAEATPS